MPKKQLAVYLRLSLEDTGANDESNSITAQRGIIAQFIQGQPELASMKTVEFVDEAVIIGLKTLRLKKCQKHAAF